LHISFAKLINKPTLEKIIELTYLESLTLRHTNITEPNAFKKFFETGYFPKMRILHLEKCDSLNDDALFYIPIWYYLFPFNIHSFSSFIFHSLISSCPSLQELYLPWCWEISEDGFKYIAIGCKNLKWLDLTGLTAVTGDIFQEAPSYYLPKIEYINLTYCRGVRNVKTLKDFQLNISYFIDKY
jgi:hypothetical protein